MRYHVITLAIGCTIGLVALLLYLHCTASHVIYSTPDGQEYLAMGRSLSEGKGLTHFKFDGREVFGAWWAPAYSTTLGAILSISDLSDKEAARLVNLFSLFATFVIFSLICTKLGIKHIITLTLCIILLCSYNATYLVWTVRSEALFIPVILCSVYFALGNLSATTRHGITSIGLINGMNVLVRYAGLGITFGMAMGMSLLSDSDLKSRIKRFVLLTLPSIVFYGFWAIYSLYTPKGGFHRAPGIHPVSGRHWKQMGSTISSWINPSQFEFYALPVTLFLILGAFFVIQRDKVDSKTKRALAFLFLTTAGYLLFLFFSITFLDYNTPLDQRLLAPIFPLCLLILGVIGDRALSSKRRLVVVAASIIMITTTLNYAYALLHTQETVTSNGMYLDAKHWQESRTLMFVSDSLSNRNLNSNNPYVLRHYLGYRQDIVMIPYLINQHRIIEVDRPDFEAQLFEIARDVKSGSGAVIFFDNFPHKPGQDSIKQLLQGSQIREFDDGQVYY